MAKHIAIVGAGLAGLIAAHAWPQLPVLEASAEPRENHRALLRFRTDGVSKLTGIDFKRVRVRKGIYSQGTFVQPDLRLANLYSRKVLGVLSGDRSIWNIEPVDRFVAPLSFYEQLVDAVGPRVHWDFGADFDANNSEHGLISTAPLPNVLASLHINPVQEFKRAAIHVTRLRLAAGVELYQTVYFPDMDTPLYRASITGSTLILESTRQLLPDDLMLALDAFGLGGVSADTMDSAPQHFGKIQPLPEEERKRLLFTLTHEHGIYSLGRFATWRNVLLDDVVNDIAVIKRLLRSDNTAYDTRR
jgi:hypothetical protein